MNTQSELARKLYEQCAHLTRLRSCLAQKQALEARLPEAKYRKREAEVALTEYECGGLGVFLHKLRGTYEDKLEGLRREASAARSRLESLRQEQERLKQLLADMEAPDAGMIYRQAMELSDPERQFILRALSRVSAADLQSQLSLAKTALQEAQEWARPNNRIDVAPGYTAGQLLAEAEGCARQCCERFQELEQYGITLQIHPYFQNPTGFIHAVASAFGELDRINTAIGAVSRTEKQVEELLLQLSEEET